MLVRPLADNRMLRAAGGADLTTTLGQSMQEIFSAGAMSRLVSQKADLQAERFNAPTAESIARVNLEEFNRNQEILSLQSEMETTVDSARQDEITTQLNALTPKEKDILSPVGRESLDSTVFQEPESLNELYGELDLKFDRPMTSGEAKLLADNKRAEMIRHAIISKGPSGFLPGVAKFAAGLAAMAVDPLEVASMFIPVVGVAGRAAAVARFGRVGGRVIVGATEGFAGSALTEPFYYGLSRQQQLDYTMSDALLNVGLGTIFGGGIGAIGGVLARADVPVTAKVDGEPVRVDAPDAARAIPEPTRIDNTTAKIARADADVAVRQFVNDQSVDVGASPIPTPKIKGVEVSLAEWTSGSKVVDEVGEPLTVFHGTSKSFDRFDPEMRGEIMGDESGYFFTNERSLAKSYSQLAGGDRVILEAQLSLKEPLEINVGKDDPAIKWFDDKDEYMRRAEAGGHDGVIVRNDAGDMVPIAFDPDQVRILNHGVKSAEMKRVEAKQLAENAKIDPHANPEAAKVYDEYVKEDFTGDTVLNEDIQMYEEMVKQISGRGGDVGFSVEFDQQTKLYHGTDKAFDEFDVDKSQGGGIWLTDSKSDIISGSAGAATGGNILDVRVRKDLNLAGWDEYDKFSTDELISQGFDGLKLEDDGVITYAIYDADNLAIVDASGKPISKRFVGEPSDGLTSEQRTMLDEVTEIETRAKAYADVSRVAATCMART